MKFFKVDTKLWTVRAVEGEPYPGVDADGDTCFVNTHFATEAEAWDTLTCEAQAWVSLSAKAVVQARAALLAANEETAEAAIALTTTMENRALADRAGQMIGETK